MKSGNTTTITVKREWVEVTINIIRFFLQHSTIEYDGMSQKAKVRYLGPSGWSIAVDASFDSIACLDENVGC